MSVAKVYPLLVAKAKRKGRTKEEVDEVCGWLTGYTPEQIAQQMERNASYETFFHEAPQMNANCHLITGSICGVRVESIEDPLMQKIRWLDKLVDELAKGRPMEKILRSESPSAKWKCPKCGREFRNKGQDHYCGEKPKSIDEYIESQSEELRADLQLLLLGSLGFFYSLGFLCTAFCSRCCCLRRRTRERTRMPTRCR